MRRSIRTWAWLAAGAIALAACGSAAQDEPAERPSVVLGASGEPAGIEHHRRWSDRVGQGSQPLGDVGYRNVAALGYRTILSVDGARPDAETAAKYGLRTIHVPIEYSRITRDQALRIVQAGRTAEGPIFVHCHHGLHRGPAGAMMIRIAVDGISNEAAAEELKASGCSPKYEGLYRDVKAFVPPTDAELASVPTDLPSFVSGGDIVDHMAAASRVFERLDACRKAGWAAPADEPDVSPPHEARILLEHFREMQRLEELTSYDERFTKWLAESERASARVEEAIRAGRRDEADASFAAVKKTCDTCHASYRDR